MIMVIKHWLFKKISKEISIAMKDFVMIYRVLKMIQAHAINDTLKKKLSNRGAHRKSQTSNVTDIRKQQTWSLFYDIAMDHNCNTVRDSSSKSIFIRLENHRTLLPDVSLSSEYFQNENRQWKESVPTLLYTWRRLRLRFRRDCQLLRDCKWTNGASF